MVRSAYEIWISERERFRKVNSSVGLMMQCRASKTDFQESPRFSSEDAHVESKFRNFVSKTHLALVV